MTMPLDPQERAGSCPTLHDEANIAYMIVVPHEHIDIQDKVPTCRIEIDDNTDYQIGNRNHLMPVLGRFAVPYSSAYYVTPPRVISPGPRC